MNIRTAASWVLIIFALGIAFYMFVLPALNPPIPETISKSELDSELEPAGRTLWVWIRIGGSRKKCRIG